MIQFVMVVLKEIIDKINMILYEITNFELIGLIMNGYGVYAC